MEFQDLSYDYDSIAETDKVSRISAPQELDEDNVSILSSITETKDKCIYIDNYSYSRYNTNIANTT